MYCIVFIVLFLYPLTSNRQVSYRVHAGRPGRPRVHIDAEILDTSLEYRGPTGLAPVFDCSSRTVRRRALERGLVDPCPPVYVEYEDETTGERVRLYRRSDLPSSPSLDDDNLDAIMAQILEIFPAFGRRMINGHLVHLGHTIPRERIRAAYERVMGAPAALTSHPLARRVYRVAGPNALWHHDGQHGKFCATILLPLFVSCISRPHSLPHCYTCIC